MARASRFFFLRGGRGGVCVKGGKREGLVKVEVRVWFRARQDKTRQAKTRQDKTKQNKTRQDKTKQDKTRQSKTRQDKAKQDKTRQE
jgi:hypothetical protein